MDISPVAAETEGGTTKEESNQCLLDRVSCDYVRSDSIRTSQANSETSRSDQKRSHTDYTPKWHQHHLTKTEVIVIAHKRMLHTSIIENDTFYKLPLRSQALYAHMCLQADDEGFCPQADKIRHMLNARHSELDILVKKGYLHRFPNGLHLIIHWRIHNHIRRDRGCPSAFTQERQQVFVNPDKTYHVVDHPMTLQEISRYADENHLLPLAGFLFGNDSQPVVED